MPPYSRSAPSARYIELIDLNRAMHRDGEVFQGIPAEKTYPGYSLRRQALRIKTLVQASGARTILDYGCGKATQYAPQPVFDDAGIQIADSIVDYWDIDEVECYDPCFPPYDVLPTGRYDGVISTDVFEHCPDEDLPWIVDEIFGYARKFVFANIASYPASKRLSNGENAHCTVQPPAWWTQLVTNVAKQHPGITWELWISVFHDTAGGRVFEELQFSNR